MMAEVAAAPDEYADDDFAICPYCKFKHGDAQEMGDGRQECENCGKFFHFEACSSVTYVTKPLKNGD